MAGEEIMEYVTQAHDALRTVLSHVKPSRYLFWYASWPHPMFNQPRDSSSTQNRYLTMLYVIWLTMGMYFKRR